MNNDLVVAISDRSTDALDLLFNSEAGRRYLIERRGLDPALISRLDSLGLSSIANVLTAIKTAKRLDLGAEHAIVTVATDSAAMYGSERRKFAAKAYPGGFDVIAASEVAGRHLDAAGVDHVLELSHTERNRIFNLGYYTWVEQQGVPLAEFDRRRGPEFWEKLQAAIPRWDRLIEEMNAEVGLNRPGSRGSD
jgi:hypothetical protein